MTERGEALHGPPFPGNIFWRFKGKCKEAQVSLGQFVYHNLFTTICLYDNGDNRA